MLRLVLAALLAFATTLAVAPPLRATYGVEFAQGARAEKKTPQKVRRIRTAAEAAPAAPEYASRVRPEPEAGALFQRPPPSQFLAA